MSETTANRPTFLDRTFTVTLILKGIDGVLELIGGVLLLFVRPGTMIAWVHQLTQHELSEDPHDLIATTLLHWTHGLSTSATIFGSVYLLLHGAIKVVLVWAVLKDQLWAYPWMIAFLLVFIVYQSYRMLVHFTWGMLLLTVFDILIVALTIREYGVQRERKREGRPATV
jgi:uncharacterized membrane protein